MGTCWRCPRWVWQLVWLADSCVSPMVRSEGCRAEDCAPLNMWLLCAAHSCKEDGTATAEARHLEKV